MGRTMLSKSVPSAPVLPNVLPPSQCSAGESAGQTPCSSVGLQGCPGGDARVGPEPHSPMLNPEGSCRG